MYLHYLSACFIVLVASLLSENVAALDNKNSFESSVTPAALNQQRRNKFPRAVKLTRRIRRSMPVGLSDYVAARVNDGRIYFTGGCTQVDPEYGACVQASDVVWEYDVKRDTYKNLTTMMLPRSRHGAGIVHNRYLVIFGGIRQVYPYPNVTEVYDLKLQVWTTYEGCPLDSVSDFASFAVRGRLFATGGFLQPDYQTQKSTYEYAGQGRWIKRGDLSSSRGDIFATVFNGQAYVAGGWSSDNDWIAPLTSIEVFNPRTNKFTVYRNDLLAPGRGDAAIAALRSRLFVLGGEQATGPAGATDNIQVLTVSSVHGRSRGQPTIVGTKSLSMKRIRFQAFSVDSSSIYIFGGQTVGNDSRYELLDQVEQYKMSLV